MYFGKGFEMLLRLILCVYVSGVGDIMFVLGYRINLINYIWKVVVGVVFGVFSACYIVVVSGNSKCYMSNCR